MRKSFMEHSFSDLPEVNIQRSTFDRSHGHSTTFDSDFIVPVLVDEVLPGDTFKCEMTFLCRMNTPLFPIMSNLYLDSFFFFVPYRIVWENFKKFMGERVDPGDSIDFTIPVVTLDTDATALHGCLADYLGIPLIDYNTSNYTCNALIIRAYYKIFNDWFRDQNLKDSVTIGTDTGDGPIVDTELFSSPIKRGKRHDYFTSCLPWLQKGDAVELPLGTEALIKYYEYTDETNPNLVRRASDDALLPNTRDLQRLGATGVLQDTDSVASYIDPNDRWYADLSAASAATVSEVRQAFQLQKFLEKEARSGSRYVEIVMSHFGIKHAGGDARFQRPEYLGGGSSPINITPLPTTADTGSYNVGQLAAIGECSGRHNFIKSFTEHGVVMGLINVRADIAYQEGFEKMWNRETRYDFPWPVLCHVGEQPVYNREIYIDDATITAGTDEDVFGYQEKDADWRYKPSRVSGLFRSNAGSSLDVWHLYEEFGSTPVLNSSFIVSNASEGIDRAIAAPSEPQFNIDMYFNYVCTRPLPVHAIPGFIDHF